MSEFEPQRVQVIEKQRVFEGFLSIDRAVVSYERFDGTMSAPVTRLVLERGEAAGVLLYDLKRDEVGLVEQFRYPAYAAGKDGWLLEIVAGVIPEGGTPEETALREVREEAGYEVQDLDHLATCFLSPGGSTERIHIYMARVDLQQRPYSGGGLASEGEDMRLRILGRPEALALVGSGLIQNAATIIALQAAFCTIP
jgi:ADP-ribose pyrophosphatase